MKKAAHLAAGITAIVALASGVFLTAKDSPQAFDSSEAMFLQPDAEQDLPPDAVTRGGASTAALAGFTNGWALAHVGPVYGIESSAA